MLFIHKGMTLTRPQSLKQSLESDERYLLLLKWLDAVLDVDYSLSIASADASFRRYFRVTLQAELDNAGFKGAEFADVSTMIVMDAPPKRESLSPFYEIATDWRENEVNTPSIYAKDSKLGFMLLEDFGNVTFLNEVKQADVGIQKSLYEQALAQLLDIQIQNVNTYSLFKLPIYTTDLLQRECELFREWFLQKHCDYFLSFSENSYLDKVFESLIDSALVQDQVPVHRDYHSRNLMIRPTKKLGIIDFQDAVLGPLFYDAVSLLKDCYIKLDTDLRDNLFLNYHQTLVLKELTNSKVDVAKEQFDFMGLQRHLKAIGIFCRLYHRDGKSHYLKDIPRTASYILELESRYPKLERLCTILRKTLQGKF